MVVGRYAIGIAILTMLLVGTIPSQVIINLDLSEYQQILGNDIIRRASTYNGNVLYVGGSGPNNYTSIQDAIDNASDGDTVFVFDDSSPYYENVDIDKSIHLVGKDKDTTLIDGSGNWTVVNITANNIIIREFTIQNGKYEGIHIYSHHNHISYNNIFNNGWEGISIDHSNNNHILWNNIISTEGWGISIDNSHNNTIANNQINSNERGISLMRANDNNISNNIFSNHSIEGITLWIGRNNLISHNIFSDNEVGIYLLSPHNIISNNSFHRNGLIVYSSPNIVINNTINSKPLIYIEGYSNIIIKKQAGQIILVNSTNITIQHQNISYTSAGIELFNTDNCLISDNNIFENGEGIFLYNSSNNKIIRNACWNNYEGIFLRFSHSNEIIDNTLRNTTYVGIDLHGSHNNIVRENSIHDSGKGMIVTGEINKIINNTILNSMKEGVWMGSCDLNVIKGNNIGNNEYGILLTGKYKGSWLNIISSNTIHHNKYGIFIQNGYINLFCNNWFIDNDKHILVNYIDRLLLNIWFMNHWQLVSSIPPYERWLND